MADQYFVSPIPPFHAAVGASFGTFTATQDVSPLPLPVIFGYQLRVGSHIELEAEGEYSTTGTPTFSLGFTYGAVAGAAGGVVLAQSGLAAPGGTGAAAWPFHIKYRGVVVGVGTSGSIVGQGVADIGTALTTQVGLPIPTTQALRTVTIDTTVNKLIGVCAQYGTSSASNTVKVNNFTGFLIN